MTKIRKYNGVYKLPIKTHTPVRRPMSKYKTYMQDCEFGLGGITIPLLSPKPITDISKGLEDPLTTDRLQRDINAFRKKFPPIWPERKPSLLTRVKERFKR